jgi:hypothetical protein
MDYWYWDRYAVFVCDDHLAWFNDQGRIVGPGGRIIHHPFDDYLARGPWVAGMPERVLEELNAAVKSRQSGSPRKPGNDGPNPFRPPHGGRDEWEYFGPYGVRFEGDHLLWYEREGEVRFASGGACEQTFEDFWKNGPHMENVPAKVAAEVAAAIVARSSGTSTL